LAYLEGLRDERRSGQSDSALPKSQGNQEHNRCLARAV